jgi:hypothetical protein
MGGGIMHPPLENKKLILWAVILFAAGSAISIMILPLAAHFPFISDDYSLIKSALKNPFPIFSRWTDDLDFYRPIVIWTINLNYQISGFNPWSYYLFNFLIHLTVTVVLSALLRKVFSILEIKHSGKIAFLLSLFFFFAPSSMIDIYWISGRTDLLCTLFILLSLLCFTRYLQIGSEYSLLLSILTSAAAALLCKETAVIIILYSFLIARTVYNLSFKQSAVVTIRLYGVLILVYLVVRYIIFYDKVFGYVVYEHFNFVRILSGIFYGTWTLFVPIDILDIYSLLLRNLPLAVFIVGAVCLSIFYLLYTLRAAPIQIKRLSFYSIGISILSICIYAFTFPSSRLMYPHLPFLLFSGGGIILLAIQQKKRLQILAIAVFVCAAIVASSLNVQRFVLVKNYEQSLLQALQECEPISQDDTIVLIGGLSRLGQIIIEFRNGFNEKISIKESGNLNNKICRIYRSVEIDGTDPSEELSYYTHDDTMAIQVTYPGNNLVPNTLDRYTTATYNEDSSIVCIPKNFLPFRRWAPRECDIIFNNKKISETAKIIFLHNRQYFMRQLGQFKAEVLNGEWQ